MWSVHVLQLLFDAAAAYSLFISSTFFALGPEFFGRTVFVFLLDFLAIYFAIGLLFDIVTLTSVLITTVKLGTTPVAFYDGERVQALDGPQHGKALAGQACMCVQQFRAGNVGLSCCCATLCNCAVLWHSCWRHGSSLVTVQMATAASAAKLHS